MPTTLVVDTASGRGDEQHQSYEDWNNVAYAQLLQGAPHGVGATVTQVLFARGCGSGTEASPLALTAVGSHVCRCGVAHIWAVLPTVHRHTATVVI
jgi:hypothetical protein